MTWRHFVEKLELGDGRLRTHERHHGANLRTGCARMQQQKPIAARTRRPARGGNAYLAIAGRHHRRHRIARIPQLPANHAMLRPTGDKTFNDLFHSRFPLSWRALWLSGTK